MAKTYPPEETFKDIFSASMPSLETLDISDNEFSDKDMVVLLELLLHHKTLHRLDISGNFVKGKYVLDWRSIWLTQLQTPCSGDGGINSFAGEENSATIRVGVSCICKSSIKGTLSFTEKGSLRFCSSIWFLFFCLL